MPRQTSGPRRRPKSKSRRERDRDHMGVGLGPRPEVEINSLDPLPEEDDAPLHLSPEQLGASIKEAIDAGEYSVNELVALSHLDIPGLDIEGEGAFDREALANITLAPPTDAEILQPEHLGPGLLNFVEIPKPPEELDALLRGDIDPELYGRHGPGQGGSPEQMGVPVDDLRNQLPTRMPDGPAVAPAPLTQAWDPLATPLDGVSRSHPSDPRIATNDLAVPPGAATRHGTNERQGGYPHQGAPYPPTTGDPIADRAIQLTQGQFQQPNVLPTGAFDHAGFGQQTIRETLARLGVEKTAPLNQTSALPVNELTREDLSGKYAPVLPTTDGSSASQTGASLNDGREGERKIRISQWDPKNWQTNAAQQKYKRPRKDDPGQRSIQLPKFGIEVRGPVDQSNPNLDKAVRALLVVGTAIEKYGDKEMKDAWMGVKQRNDIVVVTYRKPQRRSDGTYIETNTRASITKDHRITFYPPGFATEDGPRSECEVATTALHEVLHRTGRYEELEDNRDRFSTKREFEDHLTAEARRYLEEWGVC